MATSGMNYTHSAHIMPKNKPETNNKSTMIAMLATGLAVGFMGMYLTVTRPMSMRMQVVENNLSHMQTEMNQLVGTRDDLWKTNDLLTGLRQQQRQLAEAKQSLVSMKQMRNEVVSLANNHADAMKSLEQIEAVQTALIDTRSSTQNSREALVAMTQVQDSVVALGASAQARQEDLIAAVATMSEVEKLTARVVDQKELVATADQVIDSVDTLAASLMQREEPLTQSTKIVKQFVSLQNDLAQQAEMIPAAEKTVQGMVALEMSLAGRDQETAVVAARNLEELMDFQEELSSGSERITAAIQTIELLEGFHDQIEDQAGMLSSMRRDLMEITFLDSTVKQTLQVLKPLIQLSDLKRMTDNEVREAARVILDRRIADSRSKNGIEPSRVADTKIESPVIKDGSGATPEKVVPNPTDIE